MVERLKKPVGGFHNYCEIIGLTDKDTIIAKTTIRRKYLMAILERIAKSHPDKDDQNMQIEFSIINDDGGVLVMKFRDKNNAIIPETPSHVYGIAPIYHGAGSDYNAFSPVPQDTSEVEREIRNEIAKLAKEIYRIKSGKVRSCPEVITSAEFQIRELYKRVSEARV